MLAEQSAQLLFELNLPLKLVIIFQDRMRAFGVKLPFIYTIPRAAWFEDCHEAEFRYHQRFASKRINGERFDLDAEDIELIKLRA